MIRKLLVAGVLTLACIAAPAFAQNLVVKDATGATKTIAATADGTGALHYQDIAEGWFASAPMKWTMDGSGYGGVNVFSSALPAGAATAAGQATASTSLAAIAGNTKQVTGFSTVTVGTVFSAGLGIAAVCTAAGNVVLAASDASQITVPVNVGYSQFGFAIVKVVSQTATCTFTALR